MLEVGIKAIWPPNSLIGHNVDGWGTFSYLNVSKCRILTKHFQKKILDVLCQSPAVGRGHIFPHSPVPVYAFWMLTTKYCRRSDATLYITMTCFCAKMCLVGIVLILLPIYRVNPHLKKLHFGDINRRFQSKRAISYYQNHCSNSDQILHNEYTLHWWTKMCPLLKWRMVAILKNDKSLYLNNNLTSFDEILPNDAYCPQKRSGW